MKALNLLEWRYTAVVEKVPFWRRATIAAVLAAALLWLLVAIVDQAAVITLAIALTASGAAAGGRLAWLDRKVRRLDRWL